MRRWTLGLLAIATALAWAPPAEAGNWWVGGGIGLSFGDVSHADLSAIVGYSFNKRWSTGVRLAFRNTEDSRGAGSIERTDYGASLFARYRVKGPFYLQGEYEYLSYEYVQPDLSTERDGYPSFLVGGGIAHALSPHTTLFMSALYNLSYDDRDVQSPYDSAFVFRAGIGFHF